MNKILIIGCGDIAMRVAPLLHPRYRLFGLVRNHSHRAKLRTLKITPVLGDLDVRHSLARISGLAEIVLHFAPPPNFGEIDSRTQNLLATLSQGKLPKKLIYISTSGVYGDCGGAQVSESYRLNPQSARGLRRVDAENRIRAWAKRNRVNISILRVPGIYAEDRLPLERLQAGSPAIVSTQDSFTNHIHAFDLARIIVATTRHGKPNRVYNTCDDSQLQMGDYFDAVADAFQLPNPPRLPREEVKRLVSPMLWSFMNESRRLTNSRMKQELRVKLKYPTVADTLSLVALKNLSSH
jgi:nucleoside-diphosphate-sugar epimerase